MKKSLCLGLAIAATILIASLFVPLSTLAQAKPAAQTCPVTILKVSGSAFGDRVHFKNQGNQPATAVIFRATLVDAVGDEVAPASDDALAKLLTDRSEQTFFSKKGLEANQEGQMNDNMRVYGHPGTGASEMYYVRAVKFADGSTWKDDGSHSCRWSYQ
jgi:hypothetical protein